MTLIRPSLLIGPASKTVVLGRPIWRISFPPVLWGSKSSSIWTISILIFIFISRPVFGFVLHVRCLCLIIWNKERVACSWKRYRLVEKCALTLVIISRSSRWHITNIICWSAAAATACCISKGHMTQGPRLVSGHGPLWEKAFFVKPHKRTIIRHELGCSELKG